MAKINNRSKTDVAWTQLYNRLKDDGLLTEEHENKQAHRIMPGYYRWVAAIAILCISAGIFFLTKQTDNDTGKQLLTLQNKMGAITLATTLEDGSIIYLADNAQIDYPSRFEEKIREVYLSGDALFDVSGNKERPFVIETKDIKVEVLGTSFYIRNRETAFFELAVKHGRVKVTHKKNGKETMVEAGETVRLLSGNLSITHTTDENVFKGYTQKIHFKDEQLANILHVVNKEYGKPVLQTTEELGNLSLTITFSNNLPENFALLISTALNITYKEENGVLLISDMN